MPPIQAHRGTRTAHCQSIFCYRKKMHAKMHANKMLKTNRCFWQICLKLTTSTNIQKVAKNDPVLGCLRSGMGISRGRGWTQLSPTCPPPVLFLSWGQGPGGHGDHPLVPLIPQSSPSQRGVNMVRLPC